MSEKFPQEILVGLNDRDPQYHDVYRVNIATGERKLVQKNTEFAGFVTDDDYQVRFASKMTARRRQPTLSSPTARAAGRSF